MKLSIIIPVYNEKKTISLILEKINNLVLINNIEKEILVIDDASNDGTEKILGDIKNSNKFKNFKFIFKEKNLGKGHSQKIAIPLCTGDFTIIQDADLEYNVNDINSLLKLLIENKYDAVLGYRKLTNTKFYSPYFFFHKLAVLTLTYLTNICFRSNFKDVCTCYRLIDTSILKKLKINGKRFEYDFSMINQLAKTTKNIGQTQIEYKNRSFNDGKKNTWIVGFYAIKRIIIDMVMS